MIKCTYKNIGGNLFMLELKNKGLTCEKYQYMNYIAVSMAKFYTTCKPTCKLRIAFLILWAERQWRI